LFLSDEFNARSGRHKQEDLNCTDLNKIRRPGLAIIDDQVFNEREENVALPKSDFANYVLKQADNFNDFDVSEFSKIFGIIAMIVQDSQHP
jgi:RNA-directed DNA polymerase